MNIYWRNPDGTFPPSNALFGRASFSPLHPFETFPQAKRVETLPKPAHGMKVKNKTLIPTKEVWHSLVKKTIEAIKKGAMEKVVLARCCVLECLGKPDPFAIAAALQARAENATVFCFAEENRAFLGASPEQLFMKTGAHLVTEAVAGTRRRGKSEKEDLLLENGLMQSDKDLREHRFVESFLKERLEPLSLTSPTASLLHVRKTSHVQHLVRVISTQLKPEVTDEIVHKSLHPTPALCGTPKTQALDWIASFEPFERGYYGGTVSWSTPEVSTHVVAIRSCFIEDNRAILYVGTGIVEDSIAESEWEELDEKMKLFAGIFLDA